MFSTERICRVAVLGACLLLCLCACDSADDLWTDTHSTAVTESGSFADTEASPFGSENAETEPTETEPAETNGEEADTETVTGAEESDPNPNITVEATTADPVVELPKVEFD